MNKEELLITEVKDKNDNNKGSGQGGNSGGGNSGINRDKPIKIVDNKGRTYLLSKYGTINRYVNIDLYGVIPTKITNRESDSQIYYKLNSNALVLDIFTGKSNINILPMSPNVYNLSVPAYIPSF